MTKKIIQRLGKIYITVNSISAIIFVSVVLFQKCWMSLGSCTVCLTELLSPVNGAKRHSGRKPGARVLIPPGYFFYT